MVELQENRKLSLEYKSAILVPMAVLVLIVFVEVVAILVMNDGRLTYTLDDAYIHLALAENISNGHYGINAGEATAPSSTILWPFLLAPLAATLIGGIGPLALNILAAAITLIVFWRVCFLAICPCQSPRATLVLGLLTLLLIPVTNLVGVIFTGMEHSLQLLLTSLIVLGLIQEARQGSVPWWFLAAIIFAPLVRYENLPLSMAALLYLFLRGHTRAALGTGLVMAALVAGFSLFLEALGLGLLPNSIIAKSGFGVAGPTIQTMATNFSANLLSVPCLLMAVGILLLLIVLLAAGRPRAERLLAGATALAIGLHLLLGKIDGYHRYELYIWATTCLMLLYLYRGLLKRWLVEEPLYKSAIVLFIIAALAGREYATVLVTTPLAANNIYEQQYQMHRFATEFYRQPVAIVDLGRVAYQNDNYVLDLWGLASNEALEARRRPYRVSDQGRGNGQLTVDWMNELAAKNREKLAMIYDYPFPRLPENWRPVGRLYLGNLRWTVADDVVAFYALDDATAQQVRSLLDNFRPTLPQGVRLDILP